MSKGREVRDWEYDQGKQLSELKGVCDIDTSSHQYMLIMEKKLGKKLEKI